MLTVSWSAALADFLSDRRARRCKPKTVRNYGTLLRQFIHWSEAQDDLALADVMRRHMRAYLDFRSCAQPPLSPHTLYSDVTALRQFWKFCKREGYSRRNPMLEIEVPRPKVDPPEAPADEEARAILRAIQDFRNPKHNPNARFMDETLRKFLARRDYAIAFGLFETAARVSEMLNIHPIDVDAGDEPGLTLRYTKTDITRVVPVSREWLALLDSWLAVRPSVDRKGRGLPQAIFLTQQGKPIEPGAWTKLFARYAEFAGCPQYTPHDLRRYRGTKVAEASDSFTASQLLGNSPEVFNRHYRVRNKAHVRDAWRRTIEAQSSGSKGERVV